MQGPSYIGKIVILSLWFGMVELEYKKIDSPLICLLDVNRTRDKIAQACNMHKGI